MTWADLIGRALCAAVTFGAAYGRQEFFPPQNNLQSVAVVHCLSALCNACAIISAAVFIRGKASFDLQRLAYCAILVNVLNLAFYAAKSSPLVFAANTAITVISYAQLLRLLWPSNGGILDFLRRNCVRDRTCLPHEGINMETKQ